VFLKARKPMNWRSADLSGIALYSIILGRVEKPVTLSDAPLVRRLGVLPYNLRTMSLMPGALCIV
jgi:hypothetical protein